MVQRRNRKSTTDGWVYVANTVNENLTHLGQGGNNDAKDHTEGTFGACDGIRDDSNVAGYLHVCNKEATVCSQASSPTMRTVASEGFGVKFVFG
jgi:hypothetical protein